MQKSKKWPVQLLSAGCADGLSNVPTPITNYFVIVTYHIAKESYTVWAEPDHKRSIRRLHYLSRNIEPEILSNVRKHLDESALEECLPELPSIKMTGLVAALYAQLMGQCATLITMLQENSEEGDTADIN